MTRILTLLFIAWTLFSCNTNVQKSGNSDGQKDPTHLEFQTDKRVETMYIVFLLSDYPLLTPFPNSYQANALAYFNKYKNHTAVLLAKKLVQRGFVADYAVNWLFQHTNFPEFTNNQTVNFPFSIRPMNSDSLELFRKELINFYTETQCEKFFKSQETFLDKIATDVKDSFTRKDIIQVIENYFGTKKPAKYYVILSPLLHSGGFTIERTDQNELYALIGPGGAKDSIPVYDKIYLEQDMVIHEFSHNYSNPIVEQFMAESKKFETDLYPGIKEKIQQEGYATWESFMLELMVRATTIRIVENVYGKEAATELTDYEKSVGFDYVTEIVEELKIYETQRDKYPTLIDFYPNILRRLGEIKTQAAN
ncbi:MAG: DUF4932 domain-containing protein [Bacteroidia bacterium]|nr:DUF4932 domain-containing protein [Bacteroidia bacterium]MCF8425181.1 DUF4932 domain-containing protein [Bacteroidia bacterium]